MSNTSSNDAQASIITALFGTDSSDSEADEVRDTAPSFQEWHDSWEDFFDNLRSYEAQTAQLYRVRSTTNAKTRNVKIRAKKRWSEREIIPESFIDYNKKLLCTHGWTTKPRGDGQRSGHHRRSTGCGVTMSATLSLCPDSGTWRIRVTNHKRTHNHQLRRAVYENYPENRRVTDPDALGVVDELVKASAKPKKILKYLQETTGKRVTLQDVHNLVSRSKARRRGEGTVEDRLDTVLRKFCSVRGNNATIFVDETKTTQTITIQSRQMTRFFDAFPEVVMLDSTHGTNASKYKLFSFMIDDAFGHGQYVQHSLIENESHACMKDAIEAFKEHNPAWDKIRAFMIDKDFGEISLLQKEFPLAWVLICHFHLKKYLRTEMSKAEYSGRNGVDVDRVEDSLDMMIKARDEEEYDRGLRYMYYILDGFDDTTKLPKPRQPLLDYFMRNWDSCKEMWAVYERGQVAHLGNHTNNRLEASWGALKDILKPEMELDECVETLVFLQTTAELEYASQFNVIGSRHYHGADEMLLQLGNLVSPYAFDLIQKEYNLFKGGKLSYEGRWLQDGIIQMQSHTTGKEYTIKASTFSCSCFFMRTMLLPCHHTMFVRCEMNKKKVIPVNYLHPRWLLQSDQIRPEEEESDDDISCSAFRVQGSHMRSVKHAVLNGSTKWKTAMDIAAGVVEAMSSQGTTVFISMAEALREFGDVVKEGFVPTISSGKPTSKSSKEPSNTIRESDNSDKDDAELNDLGENGSNDDSEEPTQKTRVSQKASQSNSASSDKYEDGKESNESLMTASIRVLEETDRIVSRLENEDSSDCDVEQLLVRSTNQNTTQMVTNTSQIVTNTSQSLKSKLTANSDVANREQTAPSQSVQITNQLVKVTKQTVTEVKDAKLKKKRSKPIVESSPEHSTSSAEDNDANFIISKAVKNKGRPKIRRKQVREAKKLRMEKSVLLFFECMVRGIPVPSISREHIAYLRFRYLFLTSNGVFCRNSDLTTED